MSYLARLKAKIVKNMPDPEATKGTKGAVDPVVAPAQAPFFPIYAEDDRRHCNQCRNLRADGLCLAARRGEIMASRSYHPVDDVARRCEGYQPKAGDPDQRPGRERWRIELSDCKKVIH